MAIRSPLYYISGDLKQMSTSMVDDIVNQTVYQYSISPSVALSVVSSNGSLSAIEDTRLQAGAMSSTSTSFPNEATTAEPGTVTVSWDKVHQSVTSGSAPSDSGKTWPVYYNASGDIQAMSLQDVKDTFLHPAIDKLAAATTTSAQAGTYHISSSTSVTGSTLVDANPVFVDTRADTSAYQAANIPETLDQPTNITSYYLHRVNGVDNTLTYPCLYISGSNDLQEYGEADFETLLGDAIKYTAAASLDGYKIEYNIGTSGSGVARGSGMADTKLNGSGNYQTQQVGDDYRAQEFPDGTATTVNTYYLRLNKS